MDAIPEASSEFETNWNFAWADPVIGYVEFSDWLSETPLLHVTVYASERSHTVQCR